ncbi:hypothetical protein EBR21_12915, partial [bacterium]|nr:hypothetical protein [bacterium]
MPDITKERFRPRYGVLSCFATSKPFGVIDERSADFGRILRWFIVIFCQLLIFVSNASANSSCQDGVVKFADATSPLRIGNCIDWLFDSDSLLNI